MSAGIELTDRATVKLKALPEELRGKLRVIIVRDAKELAGLVRGKLSGQILQPRTGRLLGSIEDEMYETQSAIWGRVYTNDPKAAILEWGGKTKPHMIYPVTAKALRFMIGAVTVFAMKVNHPGSVIPAFAYLRTSLDELRSHITDDIVGASQ